MKLPAPMPKHLHIAIATLLLCAVSSAGYSQSIWLSGSQARNQLSIEWAKPRFERQFDRDNNISLFSSTLFISGMFKLNDHLDFVAEIPLSHWAYRDDDGPSTQNPHTTIGNVYLGAVYTFSNVPVFFTPSLEVGIRIPTMPDPDFPDKRGSFSGYVAELDRREAFLSRTLAMEGFLNADHQMNQMVTLRLRGGVSYWKYNGDSSPNYKNELYLAHSAQLHFSTEMIGGYMGLTGKHLVGKEPRFFIWDDGDVTHSWIGIRKRFGKWIPEIYIRNPIEDGTGVSAVYGFKATRDL